MTARRKDGHVRAYSKDGGYYVLAISEFAPLRDAWMAGRAFVDLAGLHGESVTLKLGEVQAVAMMTPETLASIRADDEADAREQREREMLEGGD